MFSKNFDSSFYYIMTGTEFERVIEGAIFVKSFADVLMIRVLTGPADLLDLMYRDILPKQSSGLVLEITPLDRKNLVIRC